MRVIRDYAFELCWLLLVLIAGVAPIGAQTEVQPPVGRSWDDQGSDCGDPPGGCIIINPE